MRQMTRPFLRRLTGATAALAVLSVFDASCARAAIAGGAGPVTRTSSGVTPAGGGAAGLPESAPADTGGPVTLRADSYHYMPGAKVGLALANQTDARYAFNPCNRILEQSSATGWSVVSEPGRVCTMEAWILDPRGTRNATTELPASLPEGRYRVVIELSREGTPGSSERVRAVTAPFHAGG